MNDFIEASNREVAELATVRDNRITEILRRLDLNASVAAEWAVSLRTFAQSLSETSADHVRRGDASGPWQQCNTYLRDALERLVGLGHDLELLISERVALVRTGIRSDRLFQPFEQDLGVGNVIRFEQNGDARLVHTSGPDCLVAGQGELTIDVPIKLTRPGAVEEGRINITVAISTPPGRRDAYTRILSRGAHFCPGDEFSAAEQMLILDRVAASLGTVAGPLPLPPIPALPLGTPLFYAGRMQDVISLPATIRKRARYFVPRLAALPEWADSALKLVPDTLIGFINGEVRRYGFGLKGPPAYNNSGFDLVVGREENYTRKIACVEFGIVLKMTAVIRCNLIIENDNNLIIHIHDIDKRVEVDMRPNILTDVIEYFVNLGAAIITQFLGGINRRMAFPLRGVQRATIEVRPERIVLFFKTRELPF